ncbi:MAG: hypothetical protein R3A48_00285 [Polyangiales bacterium]
MRSLALSAALALAVIARGATGGAHPLGMASVNRYVGVRVHPAELEVDYLVDLAEIPAWTEIERLDADHDGRVLPAERDAWLDRFVPDATRELRAQVNGRPAALRVTFRRLEAPPGQNGLSTLRVAVEFRAPLPPRDEAPTLTVRVEDTRFRDRNGWRELAAASSPAARLTSSSLPADRLRAGASLDYPTRALDRAPRDDAATFTFARTDAAGGDAATGLSASAGRRPGASDGARLVALLRDPARSPGFALFALALAFALGAGHALAPGHGKALVGAWLLGSRGRARDAVTLGAAITVTHTASVFALGALALVIERRVGSDKVLRALELMSGAMVMGVAASQLPGRLRALRAKAPERVGVTPEARPGAPALTTRAILAMGVSGGMVPCPGARVVLLAAISMRRVGFGLALLVAFSLGLAAVLSGVGLLFVLARRWFDRMPGDGRALRALAVLSSCAVLCLGAVIVAKALLP